MGHIKVIRSGNFLEIYEYEKNVPIRRRPRRDLITKRDRRSITRTSDSIRRAGKSFRRLVRANLVGNETPTLLTLTMYETLPLSTSSKFFNRFIDRLRRSVGHEFRYIAVPEFQKRGAVHFHILIWGLDHKYAQTEHQTRYFSRIWLRGFCDCVVTDGHPKLAGYLSKYMQKGMSDIRLSGKKAYYASSNILRPMSTATGNPFIKDIIYKNLVPVDNCLHEHEFMTQWLGKCYYKSYLILDHESNNSSTGL